MSPAPCVFLKKCVCHFAKESFIGRFGFQSFRFGQFFQELGFALVQFSGCIYLYNDDLYDRTRTAFKRRRAGFTDDEFYDLNPDDDFVPTSPNFSTEALQGPQERYQRDWDLALLITIGLYALNIIDANVDAHLQQYNVNEDLSLHFEPYLDFHPISAEASYGIGLLIRF